MHDSMEELLLQALLLKSLIHFYKQSERESCSHRKRIKETMVEGIYQKKKKQKQKLSSEYSSILSSILARRLCISW